MSASAARAERGRGQRILSSDLCRSHVTVSAGGDPADGSPGEQMRGTGGAEAGDLARQLTRRDATRGPPTRRDAGDGPSPRLLEGDARTPQ